MRFDDLGRTLRMAIGGGGTLVAGALLLGACGDSSATDDPTGGGGSGAGGSGGGTSATCDPAVCNSPEGGGVDNICVDNQCALPCTSHAGCPKTMKCGTGIDDLSKAEVNVCVFDEKSPFLGRTCPFGSECNDIFACTTGEPCGQSLCQGQACAPDPALCDGDADCQQGYCPNTGERCVVQPCAAELCKPLTCLGFGEGDAEAICTNHDCQADADCGPGFYCGITRSNTNICGTNKGEDMPCLDAANFGDAGATFQEGPVSLLRNTCLPRPQCSPCEVNTDCSPILAWDGLDRNSGVALGLPQNCVSIGGANMCAQTCVADGDCDPDYACDLTNGVCLPRFGACSGTGEFCEPCLNDLQCGSGTGTKSCRSLSGNQTACFDGAFPDTCTVDGDCPMSPSGLNGECLDEGEGLTPSDSVYHRCFFPFNNGASKFGCWGP